MTTWTYTFISQNIFITVAASLQWKEFTKGIQGERGTWKVQEQGKKSFSEALNSDLQYGQSFGLAID